MKAIYEFGKIKSHIVHCALCVVFVVSSCGQEEKQVAVPSDILPKEKMAQVITGIHIAEAEANMQKLPDLPALQAGSASTEKSSFENIFKKHKITKEQYEKSLSFYIDHPELLDQVYEKVLNELSKMQGSTK